MKTKRILFTALVLLVLSLSASAEGYLSYVVSNTMPVYQQPHPFSRLMGTMSYGEDVRVLSWKDNWLQVQNNKGQVGYCEFGFLSVRNPNTLNTDAYVKEAGAYVFAKPGSGYKVIGTATMGQHLTALAVTPDGHWVRVSNGRRIGYIPTDALSKTPTAFHGALNRVWITGNHATIIRTSADMSSGSAGIVSHGQDYELIGKKNGQVCLRNSKGKTGWIDENMVTAQNPNTMSETMYAQISGRLLFTNAIFSAKYAGPTVKLNQPLTVVAMTPNGQFCRVSYGGKYYYASSLLLGKQKAPAGGHILRWKDGSDPLYLNGKIVYWPKEGEELLVLGTSANSELLKVQTHDGTIGYRSYGFFTS